MLGLVECSILSVPGSVVSGYDAAEHGPGTAAQAGGRNAGDCGLRARQIRDLQQPSRHRGADCVAGEGNAVRPVHEGLPDWYYP